MAIGVAAEKSAAGLSLRFIREPYLAASTDPGRPFRVLGPFADEQSALVQFRFFESTPMRSVSLDVAIIFIEVHELLMRLPADSVIDAAMRVVTISPGTVWLRAERLLPGTRGYAVLRVGGGTLQLDQPAALIAPTGGIQVALGANWVLSLEPEAAPAADADGSDANAMALQLPTRFELRSDGSSTVTGPIGVSGFGSTLSFDTPVGVPVAADQAIVFAYDVGAAPWSIAGNRSALLGLTGDCTVSAALWGLPLTAMPPEAAGEAAHGGLIGLRFQGTVQGTLSGGEGRIPWIDPTLLASAQGFEWRSRRADASARLTLGLWGPARSDLVFGDGLTDLRFDSRRDGADILTWSGGRLRNRWDLPRDASGAPFACDATIDAFSTVVEADGLRRVALEVALPPPVPARLHGLALENLYLSVSPVRRLAFAASGPALDTLAFGRARLLFDVMLGEPMLPDPYAANWPPSDQFHMTEGALSVVLRWHPDAGPAAPSIQARLEQPIRFPEPGDIAAESDPRLGEQFRHHLQAQPEFMSLLDLSTRDHHFGVALESIGDQVPKIDGDNRLSVELRHVRLLMQPQVHWEPVQVVTNPKTEQPLAETLQSTSHGGQTLLGASAVKLVPVLPGRISEEIAAVANGQRRAAALFSLPFGLRAAVQMAMARKGTFPVPPVTTDLHAPAFDAGLVAALQLRLRATGGKRAGEVLDASRGMPGAMHQTAHVERSINGLCRSTNKMAVRTK